MGEHTRSIDHCASTMVEESEIALPVAKAVNIARDLDASDFISGSSPQSCRRYAPAARYSHIFLEVPSVIWKENAKARKAINVNDRTILFSNKARGLLYLRASSAFLKIDKLGKEDYPEKAFYISIKSYINGPHLLLISIQNDSGLALAERPFDGFMRTKIFCSKV